MYFMFKPTSYNNQHLHLKSTWFSQENLLSSQKSVTHLRNYDLKKKISSKKKFNNIFRKLTISGFWEKYCFENHSTIR